MRLWCVCGCIASLVRAPRFSGENFDKNIKLVHKFEELAKKKGCTPGQLCLAWIMFQGGEH